MMKPSDLIRQVGHVLIFKTTAGEMHLYIQFERDAERAYEAITDLTKRLDKLVAASRSALPHLHHYYKLYLCKAVSLDIGSFVSAIANAEPKP